MSEAAEFAIIIGMFIIAGTLASIGAELRGIRRALEEINKPLNGSSIKERLGSIAAILSQLRDARSSK